MLKRFFILLACAVIMTACAMHKDIVKESDVVIHTERQDSDVTTSTNVSVIDTAWWDVGTYIHTIITFEPDTMPAECHSEHNSECGADSAQDSERKPESGTHVTIGGMKIDLPGASRIKSIDNTEISRDTGGHGKKETRDSVSNVATTNEVADVQEHKQERQTPVHVVRPWKVYAWMAAIIAILALLLWKRSKLVDWIRKFIAMVHAFF